MTQHSIGPNDCMRANDNIVAGIGDKDKNGNIV